ncbi:MAG: L-serine ammonia-lyase, iron-sulfur-dependent, subunit alpha, partial [Culicoidibacterales bacterium]
QMSQFSLIEIDTAAEIAMEHHLGLTCDPVSGFVQIPCIERNAVAALRALDAAMLASVVSDSNHLCFDQVVYTMLETGKDLNEGYRETSVLGLAKFYNQNKK